MKRIKLIVILVLTMVFVINLSETFSIDKQNHELAESMYQDYFSKTREFVHDDNSFFSDGHIFIGGDSRYYAIPGIDEGSLYKFSYTTGEIIELLSDRVTAFNLLEDKVICAILGVGIVSLDSSGEQELIISTTDQITAIQTSTELIYYVADDYLYRYHVSSTGNIQRSPGPSEPTTRFPQMAKKSFY